MTSPFESQAGTGAVSGESFDAAISAARSGFMSEVALVKAFSAASLVYVGQLEDDDDPSSFQPLVLAPPAADGPEGQPGEPQKMVVLYTDASRIPDGVRERGSMLLSTTGSKVLETLPEGLGIAVNPGIDPNMELPPFSIPAVRKALES